MTRPIDESHPLHRLFRGLTEHAFLNELGIGDPQLVGYVSELLVRFVPTEGVYALRDPAGRRLVRLADMLDEADRAPGPDRRRECLRHVGDFALFWTGVFPEAVDRSGAPGADVLSFQQQGKRSYDLASRIAPEPDDRVLRRLSVEFEACAFGLRCVRKEWEALPSRLAAG